MSSSGSPEVDFSYPERKNGRDEIQMKQMILDLLRMYRDALKYYSAEWLTILKKLFSQSSGNPSML